MKSNLIITLLLMLPFSLFSQTISGKIENINGDKIPLANVVAKDSGGASHIKEFVIARNGFYSITLTKQYKQLVLEVSVNKYQKAVFVIDSFVATKTYTHHFFLIKDTTIQLNEIVVKAKAQPFQIKGDTVNYKVSAYRDGTERKIQDIIKKLPGIEVNEKTGEIKYKGKSVETVKLDGEDLFASNYTIGTRNINVDMVEQVQAIENYSDNPLLKGIESGEKVALNLTLKNKKTDYSGSVELGLGALGSKTAINASADILSISKKYKSFATGSYNNIGTNNSPFDYFAYNPSFEQLRESDLLAKKYIPDTYFNTDIDATRSNINSLLFSSYNAVFKLGKKISLKSNVYYLNDKLSSLQSNIATNTINGRTFTTSDQYFIVKRPSQIRGDFEIKYNVSKKTLLEYSAQYKKEIINTDNQVIQNDTSNFNAFFDIRDDYFKQAIILTTKLSERKALQFTAKHTFNNIPQQLSFRPAVFEPLTYSLNEQQSGFKKANFLLHSTILGSMPKAKYSLSVGSIFTNIDYNSDFVGINGISNLPISGFQNYSNYKQTSIFINGSYKLQFKRFGFIPAIYAYSLNQRLSSNLLYTTKDTSNLLVEPSISISYKINDYSAVRISSTYKQKPFSEEYFIENPVYISNRIVKSNNVSLQIQKSKIVGLLYLINNLYKQFQLNIGANYLENSGNYFSNLTIQPNSTKSVYFFLPENNKMISTNFMIEKYIPFLQGTARLKNDYSQQFYVNIINGSNLRNNSTESFSSSFFFRTAFDGIINFENTIEHRIINSKTEGGFLFNNQSIKNNFNIIVRPAKRLFLLLSTDYYLPSLQIKKQKYLFFDTNLNFVTKDKLYNFGFTARNITNTKTLNQFDIDDHSVNNFQTNLLPRNIMVSISRNF